jgi:hypothetical protein
MTASNIVIQKNNFFKAFVTDYRACNNINKRLRQYKDGTALYKFTEGEEGIFIFTINDLRFVDATLATFGCSDT